MLQPVRKEVEEQVSYEAEHDRDGEVRSGTYVAKRPPETVLMAESGTGEFAHEEVRVKQKDDETDLDEGLEEYLSRSALLFLHRVMIAKPGLANQRLL